MSDLPQDQAQSYSQKEEMNQIVAGALYDLLGWLTTRRTEITMSAHHEAGIAVTTLIDFAKMRGLSLDNPKIENWQAAIASQAEQVRKLEADVVGWKRQCDYAWQDKTEFVEIAIAEKGKILGKLTQATVILSEDGYFMANKSDTPRYKDMYFRPPITSERELELLAVIEQMREALTRAQRKLTAYVGVCTGDKELTDTILPMLKEALALTPDLSAIKEIKND